eukprot:364938-Chlamydomonas_euryale.AAC.23
MSRTTSVQYGAFSHVRAPFIQPDKAAWASAWPGKAACTMTQPGKAACASRCVSALPCGKGVPCLGAATAQGSWSRCACGSSASCCGVGSRSRSRRLSA